MELEVHPNTHVDGGSEKPPLYTNSTSQPDAQQEQTFTEPKPYPTQPYFGSEPPPSYGYASAAIQPTPSVTVVTSQPTYHSRVRYSDARSNPEQLFAVSVCLAVFCAVCGSPLTLVCFLPAIFLSKKVKEYDEAGDYDNARKATYSAWILCVIGVISGVALVGAAVALRLTVFKPTQR